ncbi:MAG: formate--phosphoribosylaminoimidazolecarboxamide ligase [Candidatus Bathyarchaeia archaeon]
MITKAEILEVLGGYDLEKVRIGTICSHSALQIFYGARQEGFRTVGICTSERKFVYDAFQLAKPDEYILVDRYNELVDKKMQKKLIDMNVLIIPHGSFVEYVGAENIKEKFYVPMYGNRASLEFEGDRNKMRRWLEEAGVKVPREYSSPSNIDRPCIVKFHGARGGRGFFIANSERQYQQQLEKALRRGVITEEDIDKATIQELIIGVRYYPQYFYSPIFVGEVKAGEGRVELLGIDRRVESNVDELYRIPRSGWDVEQTYVVTGNIPVVLRESLLPKVLDLGRRIVDASVKLFPPGMLGPFCIETICTDELEFITFEVSARIVAGTNLYPEGSPYSCYLYSKPMSMGRRIAFEIKEGIREGKLPYIVS